MCIPNHAVHKIVIKYAQEDWSEQWLGVMFSTLDQLYSGTGNTHFFLVNNPEKQLITSVFRLDYWTEVLMKWGTICSGWYLQEQTGVGRVKPKTQDQQRYQVSWFAATDSGPGNATQNLREAICAPRCTSKTNKQEKSKAVSEEIKKNRAEVDLNIHLLGLYYSAADLRSEPKDETGWQGFFSA